MTKMMMIKTRKKIRRTETRNITRMMMAKPIKKFVHREKSDMKKKLHSCYSITGNLQALFGFCSNLIALFALI